VLHEPDTSLTMNYTCDEAEGSIGGRFSRLLSILSCRSPSLMKFFFIEETQQCITVIFSPWPVQLVPR
jgi:hypothetical protein